MPNHSATSLSHAACSVLMEPSVEAKISLTQEIADYWASGSIADIGKADPPDRPARPPRPELRPPRDMPKRNARGVKGRITLIHAIEHIELNAIDLAWDIIARFTDYNLPRDFYDDWVGVAVDEARHFDLLNVYLSDHDSAYGDFPAHDGLWQAAEDTAGDLLARLAIVPMVLEARGLDTTPPTIAKLRDVGDDQAADILTTIADEEIAHVAAGVRWFNYLCARQNKAPAKTYQTLVKKYFKGQIKPPFATAAREQAGFSAEYYQPIAVG